MKTKPALATISDKNEYKAKRAALWAKNVDYWLKGPLRHVVDVGEYITNRTETACRLSAQGRPVVVDIGFGDGWLLRSLLQRKVPLSPIYSPVNNVH